MAPYDFIAVENAKDKRLAFARKLIRAVNDVVSFVDDRLGWNGAGEYNGFFKGSFNISLDVKHGESDERVLIRFPFPGNIYGPWRDEKVKNEVMVMDYLREHTTSIPVPRVRDWGLTKESPQQLGPFIIMDFIEGQNLSDLLQQPTENREEPIVLNPDIDEEKLDLVYEQIAGFLLELSHLEFTRIGAISKVATSGQWAVTGRPLTYDMNEVATLGSYPVDQFTMAPFDHASNYFAACTQRFQTHLEAQRNIAGNDEDLAWRNFIARCCFAKLIPTHGNVDDPGPFRLFCDDLRPTNMLVDPETMRITAVIDFEFTNAMPAQFANDLPWWLLLKQPAIWVGDGKMQEFLDLFVPRKEQFIHAMERVEARSLMPAKEPRLSFRMRDSWDSGRFWFNLAARSSFDVDEIYWEALHKEGLGEAALDSAKLAEKEEFVKRKMDQFDGYRSEKESDVRFAK